MFLGENSKQIYPIPRYYEARLRIHNEVKPSHFFWFGVDPWKYVSFIPLFFCLFLFFSLLEKLCDCFNVFSLIHPQKVIRSERLSGIYTDQTERLGRAGIRGRWTCWQKFSWSHFALLLAMFSAILLPIFALIWFHQALRLFFNSPRLVWSWSN